MRKTSHKLVSILLTGALMLPAPSWAFIGVTGHLPNLSFSLLSDTGKHVTAQNYRGKIVLLYFGFTGCSTQCPAILSRLAEVSRNARQPVKGIFVTVDPMHDTPNVLHDYISGFDRQGRITGLTGLPDDLQALAKRYRTLFVPAAHSAAVYIFDKSGRARLLAGPEDSGDDILRALQSLGPA